MKNIIIGLFALMIVLGTGCKKDEEKTETELKIPSIKATTDPTTPTKPIGPGGDCPCGPCPCQLPPPPKG